MGNENSSIVEPDTPAQTLESRSLEGVAKYIKSGRVKKIVVMGGAGMSTSAGIPDFRSPDTGLYANLARLNLPYAEAVFDISFFRQNPLPFYTLASELNPGKYRPTISHSFITLLHRKNLLLKHFTQNIDCLDREAGLPDSLIIEAHGSFARQSCIDCHAPFPTPAMQAAIAASTPPHCQSCSGLVKPEIVFFGEALPAAFFASRELPAKADLCIVMGTSLTVQPFASLPSMVGEGVPRVLINREQVGSLGSRPDDFLLLGDCDEGVRKFAAACGWLDELEALWESTKKETTEDKESEKPKTKDEAFEADIDKLTREVGESLKLSETHDKDTRAALSGEIARHMEGGTEASESDAGPAGGLDVKSEQGRPAAVERRGDKSDLQHVYAHLKSNLS